MELELELERFIILLSKDETVSFLLIIIIDFQ